MHTHDLKINPNSGLTKQQGIVIARSVATKQSRSHKENLEKCLKGIKKEFAMFMAGIVIFLVAYVATLIAMTLTPLFDNTNPKLGF